jgi:hypothetical protein
MDRLDSNLNPTSHAMYHPAVITAMRLARNKMNRYYSASDDSSAYRIAMGMYHMTARELTNCLYI